MVSLGGHLQYRLAQLSHKSAAPICLDVGAQSDVLNTHPRHPHHNELALLESCSSHSPLFLFMETYSGNFQCMQKSNHILKSPVCTTQVSTFITILLILFYLYLHFAKVFKSKPQLHHIFVNIYMYTHTHYGHTHMHTYRGGLLCSMYL